MGYLDVIDADAVEVILVMKGVNLIAKFKILLVNLGDWHRTIEKYKIILISLISLFCLNISISRLIHDYLS